ncbi:hypothetical protein BV22DRAFT_1198855 [Leucogyrophana mollusca]|uniref:Uncharacterized protein n=1 Tax=Leucogyrophana mollusca TaxID=85980 RepID=A0ACB8B5Y6_9AGAM|nr:hypothetical protein BV22DRAFT_1198855 [Leucogyrophana mollusca]
MVNWTDPSVEAQCGVGLEHLNLFLLGLYGWEYCHTLQIETSLLRRQLPFRWALLPYVIGRFTLLLALVALVAVGSHTPRNINCGAVYRFLAFAGNVAIGCASTNLMIRTWVIWKEDRIVLVCLTLVSLGHWSVLMLGLTDIVAFMDVIQGSCIVQYANHANMSALFMYTMLYDLLVLVLTIAGLSRARSASALWRTLYNQGVTYFAITFVANIVPMIFSWLNLNAVMNVFFAIPAATISTIASCRAVVSLLGLQIDIESAASSASTEDPKEAEGQFTTRISLPTTSIIP